MESGCSPGCRWWCLWLRLFVLSFFPRNALHEIWDLIESVSEGFLPTLDIVNFPFLDDDVPRSTSYGVYITQFIRFPQVSSHVDDFNIRNKVLTANLLRQGYAYDKIRRAFSKYYMRHFDIVSKYNVDLKTFFRKAIQIQNV